MKVMIHCKWEKKMWHACTNNCYWKVSDYSVLVSLKVSCTSHVHCEEQKGLLSENAVTAV